MKNKSCHSRRTKIVRRSKKNLRRTIKRKRLGKGRRRPTRRYSRVQRGGISKAELDSLIDKANGGDANSEFDLGERYNYGNDVEKNYVKAAEYYKLAADQNHAGAQFALGDMYDLGRGVEKNYVDAAKYYKLAAERGYADAQFALGNMYEHSRGVEKNYVDAVKYYKLAADQNHADAQFALGNMWEGALAVEQREVEAAQLYNLAAEQFHGGAHFALGKMYDDGRGGFEKDVNEAYKLYLKAKYLGLGEEKQQDDLSDRLREIKRHLIKGDAAKIYEEVNTWWRQVRDL